MPGKKRKKMRWQLAMSGRKMHTVKQKQRVLLWMKRIWFRGYIGLLRAAKRFDPNRSGDTDIRWWVQEAQMTRAIDHKVYVFPVVL